MSWPHLPEKLRFPHFLIQRWYLVWTLGQLSSAAGTESDWKTIPLAGQVNPGPQTLNTLSKPHYTDLRCFVAPPHQILPTSPFSSLFLRFFSNENWISFLFFNVFMLSFVNLNQKWAMRHKRETHTQFNDVFTDNSNCQILVPNDIVQSADAHNCLSLSLQLAPPLR